MALPSLLALPGRLRRLLSLFSFRLSFLLLILGLLSSPLARARATQATVFFGSLRRTPSSSSAAFALSSRATSDSA